jgi:hypothetical protein
MKAVEICTPSEKKPLKPKYLQAFRLIILAALIAVLSTDCSRRGTAGHFERSSVISVWYGNHQLFGEIGNPQQWVNILGNVSGHPKSLSYSLNGGPSYPLAIGPSLTPSSASPCSDSGPRRSDVPASSWSKWRARAHRVLHDSRNGCVACLARRGYEWLAGQPDRTTPSPPRRVYGAGDFNVELDINQLRQGSNTLILNATGGSGKPTTAAVDVNYSKGKIWPLPYVIDWSRVTDVSQAVQIVDGYWINTREGLRTGEIGYDRIFAIGDLAWTDYEITVPIKVNAIDDVRSDNTVSGGSGFGMITHWRGHSYDSIGQCECSQPRCGWFRSGGEGWFSASRHDRGPQGLQINDGSGKWVFIPRKLELHTWYFWKTQVQTIGDTQTYRYQMKVWKLGEKEPLKWDLKGVDAPGNSKSGSILLDAHHVDATFGNIAVVPGPFDKSRRILMAGSPS